MVPGTFTTAGKMTVGRTNHTATLLRTGFVLIAGYSLGAELYDPSTGMFTATGSMTQGRDLFTATLLDDGRVLVAGGDTVLAGTEIYDPSTGTFKSSGSMIMARDSQAAALLENGNVLIAGGRNTDSAGIGQDLAGAEVYDFSSGIFSATGSMTAARFNFTLTLLDSGKVPPVSASSASSNVAGSSPW